MIESIISLPPRLLARTGGQFKLPIMPTTTGTPFRRPCHPSRTCSRPHGMPWTSRSEITPCSGSYRRQPPISSAFCLLHANAAHCPTTRPLDLLESHGKGELEFLPTFDKGGCTGDKAVDVALMGLQACRLSSHDDDE